MTGRSERLPKLLTKYPMNNFRESYSMAIYFLVNIGQCPIKNEQEVIKNRQIIQIKNECQLENQHGKILMNLAFNFPTLQNSLC